MILNKEIYLLLYKVFLRSCFDHAMSIWNPHVIKYIESIESVQLRATKLLKKITNLIYPERLKTLTFLTLKHKRLYTASRVNYLCQFLF